MDMALHTHTPALVVTDPRGLTIRNIAFCRSAKDQPAEERVTYQTYDAVGRLTSQRDARLSIQNLRTTHSLGGQALLNESVDAGWRLGLASDAGQTVQEWDGRGCQRRVDLDVMLRPLAITEQGQVTERFCYGGPDDFEHNQCNQLVRHDDTAGTHYREDFGLSGAALTQTRCFLQAMETLDWPLDEAERDALLENNRLQTQWRFDALGQPVRQTDAAGNVQLFNRTVCGQLRSVDLKRVGADQCATLVSDIHYNALEQIEQETAGNGILSRLHYDPYDGRLLEVRIGSPVVQHLVYGYDPAGNIEQIEDAAQPIRFFANQRVEPINRYRYDTLYQLVEATGREVSSGASHGPALPGLQPLPLDPNRIGNYTQSYDYDRAGNLLQMRHLGAQPFTRTMLVATDSNRSLPEAEMDVGLAEGFDANGNLLHLVRGQALEWDTRNRLRQITSVARATAVSDHQRYVYDGAGQRCRKIDQVLAAGRTLSSEVRYLPGLEIRTTADGQILHVITAHAGRSQVRVLHWEAGQPSGIANDQIRYGQSDHLGSSTLELDCRGELISQEGYYPFGGTSWWAARSAVEANYKTVRYSGKERDAGGLYYYGYRYYAPWLQRWISPDPVGVAADLHLYRFVMNDPVGLLDDDGLTGTDPNKKKPGSYFAEDLEAHLDSIKKSQSHIFEFMESAYTHDIWKPYYIASEYRPEGTRVGDHFHNKFKPYKWTFKENFKHVRQEPVVHADQVALEQYLRVARHEGFLGRLPSLIKRSFVVNQGVVAVACNYESGSDELRDAFLTSTQNGKSTQRILNTFRLVADKVTTRFSNYGDLDVYIHVRPENPALSKMLETPGSAQPKASRFTVTTVEAQASALPQLSTSRFSVSPAVPGTSRFTVVPVRSAEEQGKPRFRKRAGTY